MKFKLHFSVGWFLVKLWGYLHPLWGNLSNKVPREFILYELNPGLTLRRQEPSYVSHHLRPPWACTSRKLQWGAGSSAGTQAPTLDAGSQPLGQISQIFLKSMHHILQYAFSMNFLKTKYWRTKIPQINKIFHQCWRGIKRFPVCFLF